MPKKNNRSKQDLKPILHIFCEGEKTEPNYLKGYLERFFSTNRRLKVIKIEPTNKNTPKQLVEEAIKKQKYCPDGDSFWVVYDRESEQKYSDNLHAQAYNKAQKHNIDVALSNVCFEAWLLLHFTSSSAPYNCYDDLRKKSNLRAECKKRGVKDYDKGNKEIFDQLTENEIKTARVNAKRINEQSKCNANSSNTKPYQLNPFTDVYLLLDAIDAMASKQ